MKCQKSKTLLQKNAFDGLIIRLNKAKKKISELQDRSIEISKSETQRGERKKKNRID